MSKNHIRNIKLKKYFPPNDEFAAAVARLCILKEDFSIDTAGIGAEDIAQLDGNSKEWRRQYFFRNSIKTLMEIKSTMHDLTMNKDFKKALLKQPKELRDKFDKFNKEIISTSNLFLKDFRNTLGGHVLAKKVQKALATMDWESSGSIEFGEKIGDTHFKFTAELVVSVLLADIPIEDRESYIEMMMGKIISLNKVIEIMDKVFFIYVSERNLASL